MRKTESLFDYFCQFVNEVGSGNTYTSAELISHVGIHEVPTGWKKHSKNPYYTTRSYQTLLKRGGFLINTKRGHWMVSGTIPDWFTLAHLYTLIGQPYSTSYFNRDTNEWVNVLRCSMTRGEILSKLHGNKTVKDPVPTEVPGSLASSQSSTTHVPPFAGTTVTQDVFFTGNSNTYDAFFGQHTSSAPEKAKKIKQDVFFTGNSNTYDAFFGQHTSSTPAKVEKIKQGESEFYKQESTNQQMQRTQLDQNLRENIGLLTAATVIMDEVQILDPLVQGRVVNIFEQLKALLKTVDGRIEYKRINNNI